MEARKKIEYDFYEQIKLDFYVSDKTNDYCGNGCQSQCGGASGGDLGSIISSEKFDEMLKHRNDGGCPGKGFYTYSAFISAANAFPGFGTTGDADTRKREIAAFLGQTSHETTGSFNQSQT